MSETVFSALQALHELVPQMRSGQLKAAVGEVCNDLHGRGLWDADEDQLWEAVWQYRQGIERAGVAAADLQTA
jgi:hypothetical protein